MNADEEEWKVKWAYMKADEGEWKVMRVNEGR